VAEVISIRTRERVSPHMLDIADALRFQRLLKAEDTAFLQAIERQPILTAYQAARLLCICADLGLRRFKEGR
jgi:hypothetical protein